GNHKRLGIFKLSDSRTPERKMSHNLQGAFRCQNLSKFFWI
ncbi:hypothetical protein Y032_0089g2205, partial [Ancylostoma ceylanicum]